MFLAGSDDDTFSFVAKDNERCTSSLLSIKLEKISLAKSVIPILKSQREFKVSQHLLLLVNTCTIL
jgi:hypothetical protein